MSDKEQVIITIVGKDRTGIVAGITNVLAQQAVNIEDLNSTIMQDFFAMIVLADIASSNLGLSELKKELEKEAERLGVKVYIQHHDIFEFMHRI